MTKRITSEDCEGNIEDIEDGRYNTHVVPVSAEDDPGYEEIDYGDCTKFTVPLGRYGSHVVPIGGGGGGGGGSACPNGGLKPGTDINGEACLSVNLKPDGAIILENGQLAIDTSKLKITTDQVYPSGTYTGIVIDGPDGESWNTQYDYNQWLYYDQKRQDDDIEAIKDGLNFCKVNDDFYVRMQVESISSVSFGNNYILMPVDIELEVGDELHCKGGGDEELYTITDVSEILPPNNPYETEYRRYTFAEPVTVSWIMKGMVTIESCEPPYVTREEFEEDQKRQDQELHDALYNDPDECADYSAVSNQDANPGTIFVEDFFGRTRIHGPDPVFENDRGLDVKLTYEDGSEYILTSAGISGNGGSNYFHQYNELIPAPPDGSTVNYCLNDVNNPNVYVTHEEFIVDQARQDVETKARDAVLEAEILALAAKTKEDQDRQDDELADLRDDIAAGSCPKITCVATRFTDPNVTEDQIAVQYYPTGFSEVKVASDNPPDINKKWLNINGVRYEATGTQLLSNGDIDWALDPSYGDMEHLVGTEVTVDNCDTYVLTSGDTMTGDLIVNATVHADVVETLVVDSGENSNLVLKHDGNTKVYVGGSQVTIQNPLKLNTEGTDDDHAVTKKYIDDAKDFLHNEIIELEEEIEALAPSVERGSWEFNTSGSVSGPGKFTAYDQPVSTAGFPTGLVPSIQSIWLHSIDIAGTPHGFDNVEAGNMLELFVDGEPEYGLFEVVEVHDQTDGAGDYWIIDVNFVRALTSTTRFTNGDVCRLKIFQPPEGGTSDGFVLKSGDSMSGALKLENTRDGLNFNPGNANAKLTFENTKTDGNKNSVHIFQSGSEDVLVTSGKFKSKNNFYTSGYLYGWSGGSAAVFHPRVRLVNYTGTLMYDTNVALLWNENGVRIPKLRGNAVMGEGFTVQGAIGDNYSATHDVTEQSGTLLEAFHNSNSTDAVNYYGRIIGDKNVTTKEYVDDKITELLAKIEELEMAGAAGAVTNYQFEMETRRYYSTNGIGYDMLSDRNAIASADGSGGEWRGSDSKAVTQRNKFIYVRFPDDTYQLNSQGGFTAVQKQAYGQFTDRSMILSFNISNAEKCPEQYANNKNIWRAEVIPIDHKSSTTTSLSSFSDTNLYVTFNGGAVSQTSS